MGTVKRLKGNIKQALLAYETESKIYSNMSSVADRPPPYMDVFELFSGSSKFTLLANRHQLNALAPMDLQHGQDFKQEQVRREIFKILKKFKPWLTILGIDCRLWSIFNENLNYSQALDLLANLREDEMPLVIFACEVALFQFRNGRYFLLEDPQKSRIWSLQPVQDLLSLPGVWSVVLDTGVWGAEVDGQMIAKPMRFIGNMPGLEDVIYKRLTPDQKQWCQKIEGNLTKKSQEYPDALVHAILQHLRQQIQRFEPHRFNFNQVFAVAQPIDDFRQQEALHCGSQLNFWQADV